MLPKHQEKCHELIDSLASKMKLDCERLYSSGALNTEEYSENEYALAKILVTRAMHKNKDAYYPLYGKYKNDLKDLLRF